MASHQTILVTGGAGFIGSHLCEFLLSQQNTVFCVDNFSSGSRKNIRHLLNNKDFHLIEEDILKPLKIKEKIDQLYNLASYASPADYQKHPLETLYAGSLGVKNMLEFAQQGNAVFLQASTSEVYGDPAEHPQKETYYGNVNPVGPRACYDEAKRFAEALIIHYSAVYRLPVRIARIFNTYGPRMRKADGRVIPNFIMQALAGKPLTVYGRGQQTRSFCYIDDLVRGLVKLMDSSYSLPVNLGNDREYKILDLAEKIISLSGSKSAVEFKPLPPDDPVKRKPDISLAKEKLKWQPSVSLEQGLRATIAYFKAER